MENIILIVICLVQFIVITFFIGFTMSLTKEIREQLEITEIRDHQIRYNMDMYNLVLKRKLMLIDEIKKKEENSK